MSKAERGDTRARIQEIALELFAERGYDHTSLREIADRLGVTKAALYYHFQSKEEIIEATGAEFLAELDELVAWASKEPLAHLRKRELLERYSGIVSRRWQFMRFFQQNPTVAQSRSSFAQFKDRIDQLMDLMTEGGSSIRDRLRARLSLVGMHLAHSGFTNDDATFEERTEAALDLAMELIDHP